MVSENVPASAVAAPLLIPQAVPVGVEAPVIPPVQRQDSSLTSAPWLDTITTTASIRSPSPLLDENKVVHSNISTGSIWSIGDEGLSCATICSRKGMSCSHNDHLWSTFKTAAICDLLQDGSHQYDPSIRSTTCGALSGVSSCSSAPRQPQHGRCWVRAPMGFCRVCPCEQALSSDSASSSGPREARRVAEGPQAEADGMLWRPPVTFAAVILVLIILGAMLLYSIGLWNPWRRKPKGDYSRIPNIVDPDQSSTKLVDPESPADVANGSTSPARRVLAMRFPMRLPPPIPLVAYKLARPLGSNGFFKLLPPPQSASRVDKWSSASDSNCQLTYSSHGEISGTLGDPSADEDRGFFNAWPDGLELAEQERPEARIHRMQGSGRLLLPQPSPVSSEASILADLAKLELDVCRQPLRPLVTYS